MLSEFQFLLLLCDIQTAQSSSNRRYHRRIFNILHPHLHTRRLSLHHIRNTTNAVSTRIQTLTNRTQQHTQPFVLKDQIVRTNTKTLRITPTHIPNPASTVHIVLIFPRRRYSFLHSKQPHLTHLEIVIVTVCLQRTHRENIVVYTPKVLDSRERGHFLLLAAPFRVLSISSFHILHFILNCFRTTLIPQSPIVIQLILYHHHCEIIRTVSAGIDEPNSIESWVFHSSMIYNRGWGILWRWRKWRIDKKWRDSQLNGMDWEWKGFMSALRIVCEGLSWPICDSPNKHAINNRFQWKTPPCNYP